MNETAIIGGLPSGLTDSQRTVTSNKIRQFVKASVPLLRKSTEYKGIHTVYSGFNTHFKDMFPGCDVRLVTRALEKEQLIALVPTRGGVMLYLWDNKPESYAGPAADRTEVQDAIRKAMAQLESDNNHNDDNLDNENS